MRLGREWIGRKVRVEMDRPLGSEHPERPGFFYEVNYGYLPGTLAADGEPIDAYVLGPDQPLDVFEGEVIAIVKREDDVEDKLVVSLSRMSAEAVTGAVHFCEKRYKSHVEV